MSPGGIRSLVVVCALLAQSALAAGYHVATTGSPSGTGTLARPWDIRTGFSLANLTGGDTLWVHGGTYAGNAFQVTVSGTSDNAPFVVRNWNDEHVALLDTSGTEMILYIKGNYAWVWGLEICSNSLNAQAPGPAGVQMTGLHSKLINCYIHDTQSVGIACQQVVGTEIYGNIINYCGIVGGASEPHGYAIYAQNVIGAEPKYITDNLIGFTWAYGLHIYTEGASIDDIVLEGNTVYNSGLFWRGNRFEANLLFSSPKTSGQNDIVRNGNVFYHSPSLPYGKNYFQLETPCTLGTVTGSYFVSTNQGLALDFEGTGTLSGNVFVGSTNVTQQPNTFYAGWPSARTTDVVIRPNKYEPRRANITVLNWSGSASVSLDLSGVLSSGDQFQIQDALNYYSTPVASGTYTGGAVTLLMTGRSAAAPVGSPASGPFEEPQFGAFVLLVGQAAASPPTGSLLVHPDTLPAGGGAATLTWTSQNATSAAIDQGVGAVPTSGTTSVQVQASKTFTLTLSGPGGDATLSANVVVLSSTIPNILSKLQILLPGETAAPGTPAGKTGTPAAQTAGTPFTVTVNGVDANWNLVNTAADVVHIASSDGNATLPANAALAAGTRKLTITLRTAGSATVTASNVTNGAIAQNASPPFVVNAGGLARLQLLLPGEAAAPGTPAGKTGTPAAQTAGTQFTVTVNGVDGNWNLVNTAADLVHISSSDGNATLPANAALAAGTRTLAVTLRTAGNATVTASDATNGAIAQNASPPFGVGASGLVRLQILLPGEAPAPGTPAGKSGAPAAQTAGTPFTVTVNGVDAAWNVVSTANDIIHIASSDGSAVLPPDAPLSSGTRSLVLTLNKAGNATVGASDVANGAIGAYVTPPLSVAPGNAADFVLHQNFPNPFNPFTVISYTVPAPSDVTLRVFDMLGKEVATLVDMHQQAGDYRVAFSGQGLSSGTYFVLIRMGSFQDGKRMLLLK